MSSRAPLNEQGEDDEFSIKMLLKHLLAAMDRNNDTLVRVVDKLDSLGNKLDSMERNLCNRLDGIGNKLDSMEQSLGNKLDVVGKVLYDTTSRIQRTLEMNHSIGIQDTKAWFQKGGELALLMSKCPVAVRVVTSQSTIVNRENWESKSTQDLINYVEGLGFSVWQPPDEASSTPEPSSRRSLIKFLKGFPKEEWDLMEVIFLHHGASGRLPFGNISSHDSFFLSVSNLNYVLRAMGEGLPSFNVSPESKDSEVEVKRESESTGSGSKGVALFGQVGTGKSVLLNLLVVLCLDARLVVRVKMWSSTDKDNYFSFIINRSDDMITQSSSLTNVDVSIEDPCEANVSVSSYPKCFLIISGSPTPTFISERKDALLVRYLPLSYPSRAHLHLMLKHLHPALNDDASVEHFLTKVYPYCGPNLRELLDKTVDFNSDVYLRNLKALVGHIVIGKCGGKLLQLLLDSVPTTPKEAQAIFQDLASSLPAYFPDLKVKTRGAYIYLFISGTPASSTGSSAYPDYLENSFFSYEIRRFLFTTILDDYPHLFTELYWEKAVHFDERMSAYVYENRVLERLECHGLAGTVISPGGSLSETMQHQTVVEYLKNNSEREKALRYLCSTLPSYKVTLYECVKTVGLFVVKCMNELNSDKVRKAAVILFEDRTFPTIDCIYLKKFPELMLVCYVQITESTSHGIDTPFLAGLSKFISNNYLTSPPISETDATFNTAIRKVVCPKSGHTKSAWAGASSNGKVDFCLLGITSSKSLTFFPKSSLCKSFQGLAASSNLSNNQQPTLPYYTAVVHSDIKDEYESEKVLLSKITNILSNFQGKNQAAEQVIKALQDRRGVWEKKIQNFAEVRPQ